MLKPKDLKANDETRKHGKLIRRGKYWRKMLAKSGVEITTKIQGKKRSGKRKTGPRKKAGKKRSGNPIELSCPKAYFTP